MKNVNLESKINMKGVENKRTYFFKNNKTIILNKPLTLQINKDNSHVVELENGQTITIRKDWLTFAAEMPTKDFSFNVNSDKDTWTDISAKDKLTYFFKGLTYLIENPLKLNVRQSGSQAVVDKDGHIHYISKNFINTL